MPEFAPAAGTEHRSPRGLNRRNAWPPSPGGWRPEAGIKVWSASTPPTFSLAAGGCLLHPCVSVSSSRGRRTPVMVDQGPPRQLPLNVISASRLSKLSRSERTGVGTSPCSFAVRMWGWGCTVQLFTPADGQSHLVRGPQPEVPCAASSAGHPHPPPAPAAEPEG